MFLKKNLLFCFCVAFAAVSSSCSRRVEKNTIKVGETVTLKPMKLEALTLTQAPKNIRLVLDLGGKMITSEDDVQILMYETHTSVSPKISGSAAELSEYHKKTGCARDVYQATKDAMVGDVLICDGSVDMASLKYFVAKRPGKDDKVATNALLEFEDPASGLASYLISFH